MTAPGRVGSSPGDAQGAQVCHLDGFSGSTHTFTPTLLCRQTLGKLRISSNADSGSPLPTGSSVLTRGLRIPKDGHPSVVYTQHHHKKTGKRKHPTVRQWRTHCTTTGWTISQLFTLMFLRTPGWHREMRTVQREVKVKAASEGSIAHYILML